MAFQSHLTQLCLDLGLKAEWVDEDHAKILVPGEVGEAQLIELSRFDDSIELSITTWLGAESLDDLPASVSSALLRLNADYTDGFWAVEETLDGVAYAALANLPIERIDASLFESIVYTLCFRNEALNAVLERVAEECDIDEDAETDELLKALEAVRATEFFVIFEEEEDDEGNDEVLRDEC